jgi:hypothetical protein
MPSELGVGRWAFASPLRMRHRTEARQGALNSGAHCAASTAESFQSGSSRQPVLRYPNVIVPIHLLQLPELIPAIWKSSQKRYFD